MANIKIIKRFISLVVSTAILVILYSKIDFKQLIEVFRDCHLIWLVISIAMLIPITLVTAWRLQQLMPPNTHLELLEANRLILGASVLNMVLPSKMGEIAKAYFLRDRGHLSGSLSISLVIFERVFDLLSLLLFCVFGLLMYPNKDGFFVLMTVGITLGFIVGVLIIYSQSFALLFFKFFASISPKSIKAKLENLESSWQEMHNYFWSNPKQLIGITITSIFLWFLHLLQIWFFILALNAWTPFITNLALSPLAILAGLLPLTFAGVGTRDAALVYLYQPFFPASVGIALGILCTSRYFIQALVGLPFLNQMISAVRQFKATSQS